MREIKFTVRYTAKVPDISELTPELAADYWSKAEKAEADRGYCLGLGFKSAKFYGTMTITNCEPVKP